MVGLASVHQILGRDGIACVEGFLSVVELDVLQDVSETRVQVHSRPSLIGRQLVCRPQAYLLTAVSDTLATRRSAILWWSCAASAMQTITLQQHIGKYLLAMSTETQPQTYKRVADSRDQLLPSPAICLCHSSSHHPSLPKLLQAGQCRQARHNRCRGCIFEPSPQPSSRSSPESQTLAAYLQQRDFCPCSPGALRILLGQKMRQLVQACLGCPGYLFNEQVHRVSPPTQPVFRTQNPSVFHSGRCWTLNAIAGGATASVGPASPYCMGHG